MSACVSLVLSLFVLCWFIADVSSRLFVFMKTQDFPPDQLLHCFPGSNASCAVVQLGLGTQLALLLLFTVAMLATILGNLVVIVSVCHFKQLHNPTNVLILSLALTDLLVGVLVMPFSADYNINGCWFYGSTFCQLHANFDVFLTALSILHLICIAVDRHQAICNPLHYSRKITIPVAVIMVCVIWTLAAVYAFGVLYSKANVAGLEDLLESIDCLGSCILHFNPLWAILDSSFCFLLPCTVMVCLYTQILIVAKQHMRKIVDKNKCSKDKKRGAVIKQSEHKAAKTLSIVLGVFIFCWMPFFIDSIIDPLTGFRTPGLVLKVLLWLGYFNSALNPILYALFYPSFKKCFYLILTLKIFRANSSAMNRSVFNRLKKNTWK